MPLIYDPADAATRGDPLPVFRKTSEHTRIRGSMSKAFTHRAAEKPRPNVESLVDLPLDGLGDRTEVDWIALFIGSALNATTLSRSSAQPSHQRAQR